MSGCPEPSLLPPEPEQRGSCAHCGGELYAGEPVYAGPGGMVHQCCLPEALLERQTEIAALLGYREALA